MSTVSSNPKYIEIQGVEQTFKTKKGLFPALRDINLRVAKGEFVTLIGHSGCGKSTLLNLIAGLTTPTAGTLLCANREIASSISSAVSKRWMSPLVHWTPSPVPNCKTNSWKSWPEPTAPW